MAAAQFQGETQLLKTSVRILLICVCFSLFLGGCASGPQFADQNETRQSYFER